MAQRPVLFITFVLVALASAGSAFGVLGAKMTLSAQMNSRQVVPAKPRGNVARASGTFTGGLAGSGAAAWTLSWQVTYRNLDHPHIVIADIHYGKSGKFGPIIVRLCGPCKSGQKGTTKVKGTWVPAIKAGNSFITLITGQNPNGEVRGQVKAR